MIENSWVFPALEALHVVGLALLVGTIVLRNLRTLGWILLAPSQRVEDSGFWLMVLTGLPMLASGLDRYRQNPAFLAKMILLLLALAVRRQSSRSFAIASLVLWTLVVLVARAVIDFDV